MLENPKYRFLLLGLWAICIVWWRFLAIKFVISDASTELTADVRQENLDEAIYEEIEDEIPTWEEVKEEEEDNNKKDIIQPAIPDKKYEPITLLVPPHVNAWALQELRKQLFKEFGVLAYIQVPKTRHTYEELIREELETPTVDIVLAPSNRLYSFDDRWLTIDFKQPVTPLFHDAFIEVIERNKSTFIPFSLDPYIMTYNTDVIWSSNMTIANIQKILRSAQSSLAFPFSISRENIQEDIYPWYSELVWRFIQDAVLQKNTYTLEYLMYDHTLTPLDIEEHTKNHAETYTRCEAFPNICLLATKKVSILPTQLSHIAQLKESFWLDALTHGYNISYLPVAWKEYPFIGRWWIINKNSEHLWAVWAWITWYLQQSQNNSLELRPYTLPAFQWMYAQQKLQTRYTPLMQYIQSIQLVTWWMDDMTQLMETTAFEEVLNNNYDTTIYIKELSEE